MNNVLFKAVRVVTGQTWRGLLERSINEIK